MPAPPLRGPAGYSSALDDIILWAVAALGAVGAAVWGGAQLAALLWYQVSAESPSTNTKPSIGVRSSPRVGQRPGPQRLRCRRRIRSGTFSAMNLRLRPKGRQAVGQWPSTDPAEVFLQALAQRIAVEDDPEMRSRLEKLLDSAGQVGKGVATGIITAVVQQVSGLG